MLCIFDKVVKLRMSINDMNWLKGTYISKTINLEHQKRQNINLKLNILAGNTSPCKCEKCNPNTSNEGETTWNV